MVEQGDLVYYRENVEDFTWQWTKAKVELITDKHLYLTARSLVKPVQLLLGAAVWHVVPQRAVQHEGSRMFYDWTRPLLVAQPSKRRKAS